MSKLIIADLNFLDSNPSASEVVGGGKTVAKDIKTRFGNVAYSVSWDAGYKLGGGAVEANADAKGTGDLTTANTNTNVKASPKLRTGVATAVGTGVALGGDASADTSANVGFS